MVLWKSSCTWIKRFKSTCVRVQHKNENLTRKNIWPVMQEENQKVSEYDQEMPQPHTTDQPMVWPGRSKDTSDMKFRKQQSTKHSSPVNFTDQIFNLDSAVLKAPSSHRGFLTYVMYHYHQRETAKSINKHCHHLDCWQWSYWHHFWCNHCMEDVWFFPVWLQGCIFCVMLCNGKCLIFQSTTEVSSFPPFSTSSAFSILHVFTCS